MGRPVSSLVTVRNSSCGKVMFSQASVILSTGRGWGSGRHPPGQTPPGKTPPWADTPLGRHSARQILLGKTPPWSDTPLGRHPLGGHPLPLGRHQPPGQTPPPTPVRHHPPPRADLPTSPQETATAVDGTHPTGMHSC